MRALPTHVRLERWYRRLLWAYPIDYRRAHGEEILTMLMDSAEPGRRVPARADMVDLVRGAVRQWFRLPVGRTAVVAAVLSAVILGALGAASGSWLAWQTAAMPSDTAALQVAETVAGAPLTAPDVVRHDGWQDEWREVGVASRNEQRFRNWTIEAAQARVRAEGWTLGPVDEYIVATYGLDKGPPRPGVARTGPDEVYQTFLATRDGLVLSAHAHAVLAPDSAGAGVQIAVYPASPSWEPAAILLGWLVGATTGWILTAWASYRLRHRALVLRAAALALGLTALWSAVDPIPGVYRTLGELAFTDPGVERIGAAYGSVMDCHEQVVAILAIGLTILALAATSRRQPTARPTATAT
jgi:hypothetical protein